MIIALGRAFREAGFRDKQMSHIPDLEWHRLCHLAQKLLYMLEPGPVRCIKIRVSSHQLMSEHSPSPWPEGVGQEFGNSHSELFTDAGDLQIIEE